MKPRKTHQLNFSINNWEHLYSLQKAIAHNKQLTGRHLSISGQLHNNDFLGTIKTDINIHFIQTETPPEYFENQYGEYILGIMKLSDDKLFTEIKVDINVFEELRKNLMEYADIEGLHIMVKLEVVSENETCGNKTWQKDEDLNIIQLDYAMKGDTL